MRSLNKVKAACLKKKLCHGLLSALSFVRNEMCPSSFHFFKDSLLFAQCGGYPCAAPFIIEQERRWDFWL